MHNQRCWFSLAIAWFGTLSLPGSSNMVTGETKSFFSFAKSVSIHACLMCYSSVDLHGVCCPSRDLGQVSVHRLHHSFSIKPASPPCSLHIAMTGTCIIHVNEAERQECQ
jgi:hypothetical protein